MLPSIYTTSLYKTTYLSVIPNDHLQIRMLCSFGHFAILNHQCDNQSVPCYKQPTYCRRSADSLTTPHSATTLLIAWTLAVVVTDARQRVARMQGQRDLVLRTLAGIHDCVDETPE